MLKELHIPVFLASDDNYAPFLTTTMYSILKNTKSFIDFHVLDGGITPASKDKIDLSLKKFSYKTITYFDMSKQKLERFPCIKHYSINAFSRYFISELAPNIDKAIYMDVDIIVKGDIKELYEKDLSGYPLGAILEDFYEGNYTILKNDIYPDYNGGDKFFNSGVLLLDLKKIRQSKFLEKAVELTIELADKLNSADQDIYNILFENNFKVLDYKYNFMPDHEKALKQKHPETKDIVPFIIHYTGYKPWKARGKHKKDFDEILHKTKFLKVVRAKYKIDEEKSSSQITKISLLNFIPLYKIKYYGHTSKHYLFGFIPFLKIREK